MILPGKVFSILLYNNSFVVTCVFFKIHLIKAHPSPTCEYCGRKFDSTNSLDQHKVNECDKCTVSCALKDFGCSKPVVRVQMSTHYMTEQHQNAIITLVRHFIVKLKDDRQEQN